MPPAFPRATLRLRTQILTEARARGVDLQEPGLVLEQGLPVLRLRLGGAVLRGTRVRLPGEPGSASHVPDVITVMGSGFKASRMWPRKRDGSFNIRAVVDHLLALANEELSCPRPDLRVAVGVPASASGVHVIHAAAVYLRTLPTSATPDDLVGAVVDVDGRGKIETHAERGGLTDSDLRLLSEGAGMFLGRAMSFDGEPFEPITDRHLTVLRVGSLKSGKAERRYVLLLGRDGEDVTVADPAGDGMTVMKARKLDAAWKLGATTSKPWLATLGRRDAT